MAYKTSMKTPKKIQSVKGVSTRGLTARQSIQLKEHSVHHTKKHIVEMVKEMRKGKSFSMSHNTAMRKIGK